MAGTEVFLRAQGARDGTVSVGSWRSIVKGLYANNMATGQVYIGMILVYHWTTWMEGFELCETNSCLFLELSERLRSGARRV